ncbi:protein AF-17 isoform X2 [Protopterus annectens]|uniref:protein AF-17 isoform X2 n=1 Tax=Protopterus annectens TaxID=7888 RepID=UPI001CFA8E9D|nr:protein AF-17 isoform X2 [Protopterus annectens]
MKEMVGGCCVCSDERGWAENPLVYCDGHGCSVAVHQACYGIVQVPTGPWFCRKCESQERAARVRCELCPLKDGALKRTDSGGWAHVVCALYIPEVQFANVLTMEPILLQYVPHERFHKTCYLCEEQGRESKAATGACMTCNRHGCRQAFHVTCAQQAGLLCEEEGLEADNVKYCGYCKSHFSKMSRKDKERPKHKHKKPTESLNALVSPVSVTTEKTSSTHHVTTKESLEVVRQEVKVKKSSGRGSLGHKGKKSSSGKSTASFSSTSSSSPFQQGTVCSSLQSSQDFASFSKLDEEDEKYLKPISSSNSSPSYEEQKLDIFDQKLTISGLGSIMRFSSSSSCSNQLKARETSPIDYKALNPVTVSSSNHKRMPSLSIEEGDITAVKEKKHKGNRKSKHGPGRPKGSKNKESNSQSTTSFPTIGFTNSTITTCSRSITHGGSIPSLGTESSLLGSGIYTSNKDPISHRGGVLRTSCSTPLSSSILPLPGGTSVPQLSRSSLPSTITASSTLSATQPFSLPGTTISLSSHIFGSPLSSGPSLTPLLSQSENTQPEPDLEDCSFVCRGSSPRESLSSTSPISSLPTLFDQTVSCSSSSQVDNAATTTSDIELLLEKHENGDTGVNIVEILKSLHSLQQENQRLQEQIMSLTAKKERLQLLNVQLSVPFTMVTNSSVMSSQAQYMSQNGSGDSLTSSKRSPCKTSFATENSFSTSLEDLPSGCQSRSSSSLSLHSTPPPLSLSQQSPVPLSLPQQLNGLGRVTSGTLQNAAATSAIATVPVVGGMMGNLTGSQQLAMNGIMGNLNGAGLSAAVMAQAQNPLGQSAVQHSVQIPNNMNSLPVLLAEQQKHFLQQQLQQLLNTQQLTPEQQAVICQMIQQQRQQELQRLPAAGSSQVSNLLAVTAAQAHHSGNGMMTPGAAVAPLHSGNSLMASVAPALNSGSLMTSPTAPPLLPGNSLITSSVGPPVLSPQTIPFLNMHSDNSSQKAGVSKRLHFTHPRLSLVTFILLTVIH